MRAAFLTDIRQVKVKQTAPPTIQQPTDVLLRVRKVGVCGSDTHYFRTGRIGDQVVEFPFTIGHECVATVEAVGSGVKNLQVGRRVAVDPLRWCNECDQCLAGRFHTCRNQQFLGCPGQAAGCMADYTVMPEQSCYVLPDGVSDDQAVLVEPFAIALWATKLAGDLSGKTVGILGAGPIGLCVSEACRAAGAETVYMTEIRDDRIEKAKAFKPDWIGNPHHCDVVAEIVQRQPLKLDCVFECAGEQVTLDQGLDMIKPGGKLLIVGIPEVDRVSFRMDTMRRNEITVQPVRRQNECTDEAIELVRSGKVNLDPMVTHHYPLEAAQRAYQIVADYDDGAVKVIIEVS
ncbi:MAG: zinc-dependent alcohol dehydrogenase [Planctomycetota bacterium]